MIGLDALPRRHQSPLSSPNVLQNDRSGLCICNKSRGSELKATVIGQPRRAEGAVKPGMPRGAVGVKCAGGGTSNSQAKGKALGFINRNDLLVIVEADRV